MSNKAVISNFNAIEDGNTLTHKIQSILNNFENIFSNLVEFILTKLPKPPDKCNLKSVIHYYSNVVITADFCLVTTTETKVLKILQDIESTKVAWVDKLSGKFLKDSVDI